MVCELKFYELGYQAGLAGKTRQDNPWFYNTEGSFYESYLKFCAWNLGWSVAKGKVNLQGHQPPITDFRFEMYEPPPKTHIHEA